MVIKQLQHIYCPTSHEVKATRQWIPEKVPNILQSAGQNWMLKTQSFGYHNCKANASKSFNSNAYKIQKLEPIKSQCWSFWQLRSLHFLVNFHILGNYDI